MTLSKVADVMIAAVCRLRLVRSDQALSACEWVRRQVMEHVNG